LWIFKKGIDVDIRALQMFVEVVRQGGFSRAAKVVYATQSTVSKAVKQLEDELELQLLERLGHRSCMTQAGEIVYRRALAILAQRDDLKSELEEFRGLKQGTLKLGIPLIGSNTLFARKFADYRSRYPGVELQLMEHGTQRLEELVTAGTLDLAAALLPVSEAFDWQELWREPIDVLLSVDHPLACRDKLTFKMLADEPFILYGSGFALNPIILNACQKSGFTPKVTAQSSQIDFIIGLVATRLGIALLPRMIAEERPHPLTRRIAIDQPDIYWHIALIWRRGGYLSPAAQAWLALASSDEQG
jgi:DNA-binding transcriptional LysR family regulator